MKKNNLKKFLSLISFLIIFLFNSVIFAQENNSEQLPQVNLEKKESSSDLISKAWESHGKKNIEATLKYTQLCIDLYKEQADKLQTNLKSLPKSKDEIEVVQVLNDVAIAYFIQAEILMRQFDNSVNQGKKDEIKKAETIKAFEIIVKNYSYAQGWDQRGWYWQIAEASKQSIKKLEQGVIELEQKKKVSQLQTKIVLYDVGKEEFVDYSKYGEFTNVGTQNYKFNVKDQEGLSLAVGEGIYPNTTSVRWDPEFKKAQKEKRLEGSQWDFLQSPDLEAAFLKWATCSEPQGVKLFYLGFLFEKAGLIKQAIKCYYAIIVHFPGSYGKTYWNTPWYLGQAAISKINFLLTKNPNFGYKLEDADIKIINGFDNDVANDKVITNPGKFVKVKLLEKLKPNKPNHNLLSIKKRSGKGKVFVVQYDTGDWQLMVNGNPYMIKGVTYAPTKVGQSPDEGTLGNWMYEDFNKNGKMDGPFDVFVDKNHNNKKDSNEEVVGDFGLMKEMGVNTIRLYHHPLKINKELLRQLYNDYGIMVIIGDFLGKYAIGSGAQWDPGTDYNNEEHKKNMLDSVTKMVMEFKDEPYVLFWLLGNENVYGYACNADKQPEAFYKFASDVAKHIKTLDPDHPVGLCNGDILFLDRFGKFAKEVDIFGTNTYRGDYGFGFLWKHVKSEAEKPVFITEYGCPSYAEGRTDEEAQQLQSDYHKSAWEDIENNSAFNGGAGNSIGGVVFEWLDEWWKGYEPNIHDKKGLWTGPFPDGFMHEEWLGVCSQGDGSQSPFLRQLRKVYYTYKKLWK